MLVQRWCNVHGFYDVGPTVFRCGCVGWDCVYCVIITSRSHLFPERISERKFRWKSGITTRKKERRKNRACAWTVDCLRLQCGHNNVIDNQRLIAYECVRQRPCNEMLSWKPELTLLFKFRCWKDSLYLSRLYYSYTLSSSDFLKRTC